MEGDGAQPTRLPRPARRRFMLCAAALALARYALKRLEDVLYELSLTGKTAVVDGEQPSKRLKTSATADGDAGAEAAADQDTMIMAADFDAIRATMDTYDKRREAVIKSTRDVQKLSKQAIFSLQRGQAAKATTQLVDAVKISKAIFEEHIKVEPPLRQGSYSNAMEEFAEAVLFKVWLDDQRICALDAPEFEGLIDSTEYLGRCTQRPLRCLAFARCHRTCLRLCLAPAMSTNGLVWYAATPLHACATAALIRPPERALFRLASPRLATCRWLGGLYGRSGALRRGRGDQEERRKGSPVAGGRSRGAGRVHETGPPVQAVKERERPPNQRQEAGAHHVRAEPRES